RFDGLTMRPRRSPRKVHHRLRGWPNRRECGRTRLPRAQAPRPIRGTRPPGRGLLRSTGISRSRSAFAVVLDPGCAQAGKAVLVDGGLPVQELVDAQCVARAGLLEAQQPTAYRGDDLSLAADHPAAGV